ncbi:hypothetical protein DL766_002419 [Monosporascus sp. MC13-8B]|uniref:Extracellular membrane protein CFEM domain-containing protein n=1 Tax=Monosporascus cannonballus TaxID=155416 RepID=A0ABY0H6Z1_9PEZI|nr:hypothetical protein DL762_006320 [Monosporascus cannonballus]RYO90715.1 hypothetical protein DL763_005254 [Monosporascus cannonballus]RYP35562.1 hypothetical protein DL766_002419 [Monosporascus sp. MC13-8B]
MKTLAILVALLASSVTALPSGHYQPAQQSFDMIFIAKEHHTSTGDIWSLLCWGVLTMDLVHCGTDTECARNGSIMAEDPGCEDACYCDSRRLSQILKPHDRSKVFDRAHSHSVVELKGHDSPVVEPELTTTVVKRPNKHPRDEPKPQRILSCVEPYAPCTEAGAATCSQTGFVHSANADCVSNCMCIAPGIAAAGEADLEYGKRPNGFSPVCSGYPSNVEVCLENTGCSSDNNGTLYILDGHQECMSMCACV